MNKLTEKIQNDLKEALKSKDEAAVSTLRLLMAAIKNFEIAKGGAGYAASEEEIVLVISRQVKQRRESIQQYKAGGRQDLVDKERGELEILEKYQPQQMSEEEIRSIVQKTIKEVGASSQSDTGKVMGALSQKLKGKADLGKVSGVVKSSLGS
jgi:uncharacterized protein YqeY